MIALINSLRLVTIAAGLVLVSAAGASSQAPPGFAVYLLGFLMRGAGQPPAGSSAQELQKAHLSNLTAMWKEGLLLASGPIADQGDVRGVLVFRGDDRAAVEKRVADDPMIEARLLDLSMGPWIGPEGIGDEYKKWSAANPGAPDKMRTYQLVLLKTVLGARRITPDEQRAHLLNMDAMAKSGKLAVAGPVLEGSDLAGIFVFTVGAEEADALAASDPAVKAGKMTTERHPWMVAEGVLPNGFKVPVQ
jgi:uncharacterized protein YciI